MDIPQSACCLEQRPRQQADAVNWAIEVLVPHHTSHPANNNASFFFLIIFKFLSYTSTHISNDKFCTMHLLHQLHYVHYFTAVSLWTTTCITLLPLVYKRASLLNKENTESVSCFEARKLLLQTRKKHLAKGSILSKQKTICASKMCCNTVCSWYQGGLSPHSSHVSREHVTQANKGA